MPRPPSDSTTPASDAFTAFVHDAWRPLYRTAYLLLGEHGAAEDLAQAALAKTYTGWSRIRERDAAYGYARTVLLNEARAMFRRTSWGREQPVAVLPERPVERDPSDRPAVLDALRTLPPRQRAVVVLRFYEDLTEAQAAHALGVSVGTVKSQTSKALARLRLDDTITREGVRR